MTVPIIEEGELEEDIKGENDDGETQINKENVFYAGSRKRDN